MMAEELPPYALEVSPASTLQFTLSRGTSGADASPRCTMTLHHFGQAKDHLAFKVKTTQPRRYLVRPNQGVIAPGSTESISIILVEKEKQVLLQTFDRLGQSALDHSKDKFLVQSCVVADDFATRFMQEKGKAEDDGEDNKIGKETGEALTGMWNSVASSSSVQVYNKKLHVRHVVPSGEAGPSPGNAKPSVSSSESVAKPSFQSVDKPNLESMTPEQMFAEISSLRRAYDELVTFSVSLTAERDILNNTLEQTKRDLNREMTARASLENRGVGGDIRGRGMHQAAAVKGVSTVAVAIFVIVSFFVGIKAVNLGAVRFLGYVPLLGSLLGIDVNGGMAADTDRNTEL